MRGPAPTGTRGRASPGAADDECGHEISWLRLDGRPIQAHHEIPDDGAPHAASAECGCGPALLRPAGLYVFAHVDQDTGDDSA